MIEQLLTLARADADTQQLSVEEMDLRALLEELNPGNKTLAESFEIHWSSQLPREPVTVLGDRPNLRRIMQILVENACRYTTKGGSVALKLTVQQHEAILAVTDSGTGILVDELTRIFERFYRATNARFFDASGRGLGLSIAQ